MANYLIILAVLFVLEVCYFRLADRFNIIDKPNLRSSHTRIVLRGGGVIFTIALWIWSAIYGFPYPWMLAGVTLAATISFVDDIHSLRYSLRLVVQFVSMILVFKDVGLLYWEMWWVVPIALIVAVGATNIYNFMDGINGITGGYSLAILIPLFLLNRKYGFMEESLLIVVALSALVFCYYNFRTNARCFAGDVGSIGMAIFLTFCMARLMLVTGDISWIMLILVYGVDGCMTIFHRIMLHENLGKAHRKHAYQLMANELKMKHVLVSAIYMCLQLSVSLLAIYLVPDTIAAHWIYLILVVIVAVLAYIWFIKKYYHLHEAYLEKVKKERLEKKETVKNESDKMINQAIYGYSTH